MNLVSLMAQSARGRLARLGPGSKTFLANLSWMTFYFALSKVFSSVATVIVARYLGAFSFGEAQIIVLLAQMASLFMLLGMHVVVVRYSAGKTNPAPVVATSMFVSALSVIAACALAWVFRDRLGTLFQIGDYELAWVIGLSILFCAYLLLTSIYQALHYFKQRGIIEVVFAFLMLPGLALGHVLTEGRYETLLIAYAVAYGVSVLPMLWKLRGVLSPRHLFAPEIKEMLHYGGISAICNFGYIMTFIIQPIQLQYYQNTEQVGVFRLYCYGSINMAAFATSIITAVFFPKVAASKDRPWVWRGMTKAWGRLWIPLVAGFVAVQVIVVMAAGSEFPLVWSLIFLFAIASALITIQATYAQVMLAEGVRGVKWGFVLSVISGTTNVVLSVILIPRFAIAGAVMALIGNYAVTLIGTFLVRDLVIKSNPPEPNPPMSL